MNNKEIGRAKCTDVLTAWLHTTKFNVHAYWWILNVGSSTELMVSVGLRTLNIHTGCQSIFAFISR